MVIVRVLEKYKPSVKIISYSINTPLIIASAGKMTISPHRLDEIMEKMDREKIEKWIRELFRRGHGSPLEHSIYIFEIICSRVTSHQIVRHRIASYTQLSQRYSDKYLRKMIEAVAVKMGMDKPGKPVSRREYLLYSRVLEKYVEEAGFNDLLEVVSEAFIIPPKTILIKDREYLAHLLRSVARYYRGLASGMNYEDSRYLLPQAIKTHILVSMNARELVESFLALRMCTHAQWEIRYIAWSLWRELVKIHPQIFSYAGPRCILYDNRVRRNICSLEDYLNGKCIPVIERCPELVDKKHILSCLHTASKDPWLGI